MDTKFSKNLEWLRPFFESVNDLVPIERVKSIKGFRVPKNKTEKTDAWILRYLNNKTFSISFRTHEQILFSPKDGDGIKVVIKYKPRYVAQLLDDLAHELSHLKYWPHSVDHFRLQTKILTRFGKILKKLKVKDTWARAPLRRTK